MKSIEAICVTSQFKKRQQLLINEETGLIEDIGDLGIARENLSYYFNDDCLLFAGMGDVHIHAREDLSQKNCYKETFHSASEAAVNGGVIHMGDMPNNPIPPIDDKSYADKLRLTSSAINTCWIYAGIGPKTKPLTKKVPYKAYMGPSVGDLFFKDNEELENALVHYKNQYVSFHCEDPELLEKCKNESTHFSRRPVEAEVLATNEALKLIKEHHLVGKLCHFSSREGLDAIREFRKNGGIVQVEVTPQHLYFAQEDIEKLDVQLFQMNPPIRPCTDQEAMLAAFKNGEIDFLATDHAPHTHEEKVKGTSGLTGLDTYGAFVCWLINEQNLKPEFMAKICSENSGRFFNQFLESWSSMDSRFIEFGKGLGFLEKGYRADLTVLNLKKKWTVKTEDLKTKVKHSPFLGHEFSGSVERVMTKGKWI